jgi:hypothetical protein
MKTTIEIPDDLLAQVKAVAARRRTTLKAMMEHALRREISVYQNRSVPTPIQVNADGFPVLQNRGKVIVTSNDVYRLLEAEDHSA